MLREIVLCVDFTIAAEADVNESNDDTLTLSPSGFQSFQNIGESVQGLFQ